MANILKLSDLDQNKSYSYADYLTWRFDEFVEIIKGKIFRMSPAPASDHQYVSGNLHGLFWNMFRKHNCRLFVAPFDVRLPRKSTEFQDEMIYTVLQPDLCIICDPTKIDKRGCLGSPDLVVEILSPYTAKKDLDEKFHAYEEAGVKEYWIVNAESKVVSIYLLKDSQYQLSKHYDDKGSIPLNIFEGFTVEWEEVFERI